MLRIVQLLRLLRLLPVQPLQSPPYCHPPPIRRPHLALLPLRQLVFHGEGDVAVRDDEGVVEDFGDGHGEQDEVAVRIDGKVLLQGDREACYRRVRIVGGKDASESSDAIGACRDHGVS